MSGFQQFLDGMNQEWFHIGDWKVTPILLVRLAFSITFVCLSGWVVRGWMRRLLVKNSHIDQTIAGAVVSLTFALWLTLGLLWVLEQSGFNIASLAVFTGALGVGMGLGLQDMAKNFFAGLIMLATRPVRVGDHVEFSGVSGTVVSIGSYSTTLRTAENASVVVPNSSVLNDRVVNWDLLGDARMVAVTVRIPTSIDTKQVETLLVRAVAGDPDIAEQPEPRVLIESMDGVLVVYTLQVHTSTLSNTPGVLKGRLFGQILEALKKEGLPVGAPTVT
ncbi:MAG: mechanosensitive ion channel [Armatimonadetes bacterium]|nr:mechanosensitive ion channel [Armatimonadota bacterium]